jgi:hypothetical protein
MVGAVGLADIVGFEYTEEYAEEYAEEFDFRKAGNLVRKV